MKEITEAIEHLRNDKAAGADGILPELWKEEGPALYSKLHELCVCCWEQSKWSPRCSHRHLVQKEGRKVRLLQLSGDHSALHRRKNPCSCTPKQIGTHHCWRPSTRNPVWVQSQQGHYRHGGHPQTAPREMQGAEQRTVCSVCGPDQSVWHSEQKGTVDDLGAPWMLPWCALDVQLHEDQHGQARLNGDLSGFSPIVNGVKQGSVLAPTLFSIFFNMMLKHIIEDLDDDGAVYICYHLDDSLFNLRRLHAHTKTLEQLFCWLLFADDAALVAFT